MFFQICKHTFLFFEKGDKQKIGQDFLRFVSILSLNIWKWDLQKTGSGFLRFASKLFLIFEKGNKQKF